MDDINELNYVSIRHAKAEELRKELVVVRAILWEIYTDLQQQTADEKIDLLRSYIKDYNLHA